MLIKQFFSFAAVGLVGTAAHYATLVALVQFMHVNPTTSSGAGFIAGALVNYTMNYHVTFQSKALHRESMPKFFAVALCGLVFNTAIMELLTGIWKLHYLAGQVVATTTVLVWNFAINRYWTFRE